MSHFSSATRLTFQPPFTLTGKQARDCIVSRSLRKEGWRVVRIWEHELRKPLRVLAKVSKALVVGWECQLAKDRFSRGRSGS